MVVRKTDSKPVQTAMPKTEDKALETVCIHLQRVADICYELAMLMQHEKSVFHTRGLQGFKRCFRYSARQYFERGMNIETIMVDHFDGMPMSEAEYTQYTYDGECTAHIQLICDELCEAEEELSAIYKKLAEEQEIYAASCVNKIICSVQKEMKYMFRHLKFFQDVRGDKGQLYWYSHELHDDIKSLEESKHNRHYV